MRGRRVEKGATSTPYLWESSDAAAAHRDSGLRASIAQAYQAEGEHRVEAHRTIKTPRNDVARAGSTQPSSPCHRNRPHRLKGCIPTSGASAEGWGIPFRCLENTALNYRIRAKKPLPGKDETVSFFNRWSDVAVMGYH